MKSESERLLAEARSWERELERLSPTFAQHERRTIELRIFKLYRDASKAQLAEYTDLLDHLGGDAA